MKDERQYMVSTKCLTYNHSPYIEKAMNGFTMQKTDFPFVVAIMDDASPDNEQEILRKYYVDHFNIGDSLTAYQEETDYGTILFAQHNENNNCYFAIVLLNENHYSQKKNKLHYLSQWLEKAKYIAICEGDDYWTDPLKLQKQVDYLESNPDIGLCFTDYSRADRHLRIISPACFSNGILNRSKSFEEHLLTRGYIAPMTWVYRKSIERQLQIPTQYIDGSFATALEFFQNSKVGYLNIDTAVHVIHPDSATRQIDPQKRFNYDYDVFKEQLFFAEKYCGDAMITRIKFDKYLSFLPEAIMVDNQEFIQEANQFFTSCGACFDDILNHALQINADRAEIKKARSSKAYRLGNAILTPIRKLFGNGRN